uniref:Putative secreted protein n=1 Tax=Ixodes ricinus TaxID=34613 RepID=A0A6B0U018_IXORI
MGNPGPSLSFFHSLLLNRCAFAFFPVASAVLRGFGETEYSCRWECACDVLEKRPIRRPRLAPWLYSVRKLTIRHRAVAQKTGGRGRE